MIQYLVNKPAYAPARHIAAMFGQRVRDMGGNVTFR